MFFNDRSVFVFDVIFPVYCRVKIEKKRCYTAINWCNLGFSLLKPTFMIIDTPWWPLSIEKQRYLWKTIDCPQNAWQFSSYADCTNYFLKLIFSFDFSFFDFNTNVTSLSLCICIEVMRILKSYQRHFKTCSIPIPTPIKSMKENKGSRKQITWYHVYFTNTIPLLNIRSGNVFIPEIIIS